MVRRRIFCGSFCIHSYLTTALIFVLLAGQSILPTSSFAFSIGEEREIGEQLLLAVRSEFELLDDPEESVGRKAFQVLRTIAGRQMGRGFPSDEEGRKFLIARWRAWREENP